MNRRNLLKLAAALAGAKAFALAPVHAGNAQELSLLFSRTDELKFIGRQCLRFLPDEPTSLYKLAGITPAQNDRNLLEAFAAKRQNDFLNNKIHTVHGWVMAESECALCALIELS